MLIDFSNYFGSIDKEILLDMLPLGGEERRLMEAFLNDGCDGLSLGSEVNQTCAIYYASRIDHFVKERLRIKAYGRYMDDSYLIHEDRRYLEYCRDEILKECEKLKIEVNPKKVKIISLTDQFTWLKKRIRITESGKVLMRPVKDNFKRRRRNLRSQRKLLDGGIMTIEQIKQSYQTWRNYAIQSGASRKQIQSMDRYFTNLFGKENL